MEFDAKAMVEKYRRLCEQFVDSYVPDVHILRGETRYAKEPDASGLDALYSRFLYPHIREKKYLFSKEHKSLPKNAQKGAYSELAYDTEGRLHHAEFDLGQPGSMADYLLDSVGSFMAYFYVSGNLRIDYNVQRRANGELFFSRCNFEWSEYDGDGRLVSVESFQRNGTLHDGVIIDAEYYSYENGLLRHITRFEEFDTDPVPRTLTLVQRMVPDLIFNPKHSEFEICPGESGVVCKWTNFYRKSQNITGEFLIPAENARKLTEHGIPLL